MTHLIIPLIQPNYGAKVVKSADELAAEQIIADLTNKTSDTGPQLVIAQPEEAQAASGSRRAPLLLANQAPELLGLSDDGERFKADIQLRADDGNSSCCRTQCIV